MKNQTKAVALAFFFAVSGALADQGHEHHSGAPEKLGSVHFEVSCNEQAQKRFDRAVALLHSFWFDEARNAFGEVLEADSKCAMAHWGIAMTWLGNPFAWPPHPDSLKEGAAAIERAEQARPKTARERETVAALAAFYEDFATVDHRTRALAYEKAMGELRASHPKDREAAIFHALALEATALPTDKTFANQLRATEILEEIFTAQPDHPGVAHYLIHGYDHPELAERGLTAARRYAKIAPSAPHALHMPSHIFTRLGLWEESVETNLASRAAAKGDFDRLHAMDYLAYAYLQQAKDASARKLVDEVSDPGKLEEHFVVGFALAAIPARYAIERDRWSDAAALELAPGFPWDRFPQAELVLVFARGLGAARSGKIDAARHDVGRITALRDALRQAKQDYWAGQAEIQRQTVDAWITFAEGRKEEAIRALAAAADAEDATDKHPVTPGPVVPVRELLGEMLLEAGKPAEALKELESSRKVEPNRFRGLYLTARAAEQSGDRGQARKLYEKLADVARDAEGERPQIREAKRFLAAS